MAPKGNLPTRRISTLTAGTRAQSDAELVRSWVQSLSSPHTRRNFEMTALGFLDALPAGIRKAPVEDVRDALATITEGLSDSTTQQYVLRVKSLLSYGHKLGYMPFNAGVTIKIRPDQSRGQLAKRIMPEVDVKLLIRAARSQRDRVMIETLYAGGLRISELVGLSWADVIQRDEKVQLSVTGKGRRVRQVLLPGVVSGSLLSLRGDAGANDPVFASHKGARRLTERTVGYMLKRAAKRAGIAETVSPHWLRHAHGSHALDRGATLPEVQATLGHANVATTSGYLHARPNTSSGLKLDEGIFR